MPRPNPVDERYHESAICPLMSKQAHSEDGRYVLHPVACMDEQCQLWNFDHNTCSIAVR